MRELVFDIIKDYYLHQTYLNKVLSTIDSPDINKITLRVYGVIENKLYLEYLVSETTDHKKLDLDTQIILMLSIYEQLFINTKEHVIISEMQKLAKNKSKKSMKYISYFLHNLLPTDFIIPHFSNEIKNLSIIYSIPQPLIKLLQHQYPDQYLDIIKCREKQTFVRVVKPLLQPQLFTDTMFDDLKTIDTNVIKTLDFKSHNILVQDLGAYLVTRLLNPDADDEVLDVCAAPGNKTLHIYQYTNHVSANELHPHRYRQMEEQFHQFDAKIKCFNHDATALPEFFAHNHYDKILVDAPCSGLGVISSKPEIKYQITTTRIESVITTQQAILNSAWQLLKPGGELVYATCSINKNENEKVIEAFLQSHKATIITEPIVDQLITPTTYGYTLLPQTYHSDGFYMVKLRKECHDCHKSE